MPLCEGDNIDKYNDYYYDDDYDGIDSLGCIAPKSKESKRAFTYNSETECDDYPGTKCKLGNQCGAKGNARILKFICIHCYLHQKHAHLIYEWSLT